MGMHVSDSCINCDRAVSGADQKFCPNCGQPTPAHRIDWHFLGHELEHSVLHMDRGILYALRELMLRPGRLMRDYIEGRRGNQVKPLLMIMVTAAAVVLLSRFLGDGAVAGASAEAMMSMKSGSPEALAIMGRYITASQAVMEWANAHFAAFTLLLLPLEALVLWVVFLGYSRLNYPEWLVVTALLTVQVFVVWMVLILLHRWIPQTQVWVGLAAVIYAVYSLLQFFDGRPAWSTIWRTLLGYGVFWVASSLVLSAVTVVVMFFV